MNYFAATSPFLPHDSRRLLLNSPLNRSAKPPTSSSSHDSTTTETYLGDGNFDANVVMVLSVLLCALICSLGLNSIIRCALRCSNFVVSDSVVSSSSSNNSPPARVANTGVKKKALKTFPTVTYSTDLNLNLPSLDSDCVICLSEFTSGEKVRILPKCNHGFHVRCIDKWLSSHSSCPKCRQCLIETCHKIVGCTTQQPSSSQQQQQPVVSVPDTVVTIAPMERESLVRNYRELS